MKIGTPAKIKRYETLCGRKVKNSCGKTTSREVIVCKGKNTHCIGHSPPRNTSRCCFFLILPLPRGNVKVEVCFGSKGKIASEITGNRYIFLCH